MEKDYLPKNDSELLDWLNNFSTGLPEFGNTLGVSPAEISSLMALIHSVMMDYSNGRSAEKSQEREAMLIFLCRVVDKMKRHPSFSESQHGRRLKIIG